MKVVFLRSVFVVYLFAALAAFAQEYSFELKTDKPDAIYQQNEPIVFSALVLADGKAVSGLKVNYLIRGDGNLVEKGSYVTGETAHEVKTSLGFPGWVQIRFSLFNADGAPVKTINSSKQEVNFTGEIGAMVAPLKIQAAGEEPADFDAFWAAARAELDAVPLQVKKESSSVPKAYADKLNCWDVKIDCAGGVPVSGYLLVPVGAAEGSLPAIVSYHGAGVLSARKPFNHAARGAIALDVNAHGIENGQPSEFYSQLSQNELKGYAHRGKEYTMKFYFLWMYIRVMRALVYVKSLPELDGRTIVVVESVRSGDCSGGAGSQAPFAFSAGLKHSALCQTTTSRAGAPVQADADGLPDNQQCRRLPIIIILLRQADQVVPWWSAGFVDNVCAHQHFCRIQ